MSNDSDSPVERLAAHQLREHFQRASQGGEDGEPAHITIDQVRRVQQVVTASLQGEADVAHLSAVEAFLTAVVLESGQLAGLSNLDVDQAWKALDRIPLDGPQIDRNYPPRFPDWNADH